MERLTYDEFKALVRASKRAWHLELRDTYNVQSEDEPFARFLGDEPGTDAWGSGPFPSPNTPTDLRPVPTTADQARVALGVRLRDIRRDAGLSSTQLAAAIGWRPPKISKIEHGKQTPTEADLSLWCAACRAQD